MNPFANVIGFDGSLADAIKKLKAAILYPPNGLNILLLENLGWENLNCRTITPILSS